MDTTKVESMAKSITLEPRKKRMKTLVKHLRKDSEFLEAYREEVVEILGACSIVSLYGVQASMDTTRVCYPYSPGCGLVELLTKCFDRQEMAV